MTSPTWLDATLVADAGASAGMPVHLAASACGRCARMQFPRRPHCPACGAAAEPVALPEDATMGPCTAVLHAPPGALVEVPYLVGVARFDDRIGILGVVLADEPPAPGSPLLTVAMALPDGRLTYAFRPSTPGGPTS